MNVDGLLPFQVEPAEHLTALLQRGQNCLDGSDCGIGKTYVACAVIRALGLPTLVMPPAVSVTSWQRVGASMGVEFEIAHPEAIRTGKLAYGQWENPRPAGALTELVCETCQRVVVDWKSRCLFQRDGFHCVSPRKKKHEYGKFRWHPAIKFLVVDEAHRFGALDSLNADMAIAARSQGIKVLALSATAADSPLGLRALGYILGLHTLVGETNFFRFAFRHGAKKHPFGGLYFGGEESDRQEHMKTLHRTIFPSRGVRVKIEDLGSAFPDCQVSTELYDLEGAKKIDALYSKMDDAIQRLNEQRADDMGVAVTELLRARQEVELIMVPVFEELTRQALENGLHVAVFVNFNQTLDELSKRLKTTCWVRGSMDPKVRQENIDRFQEDTEPVILVNSQAGGFSLSLHDLHGRFQRLGLLSLGYSATQTGQVLGRLRRAGGKSKALYRIPLIANTCQEKIHRALSAKLNQLDCLNDGDLMAANLPLQIQDCAHLFSDRQ